MLYLISITIWGIKKIALKKIIEEYRDVIIQISTPKGNGTGFYLQDENLIVTNQHVVENYGDVVVSGTRLEQVLAPVVYTDTLHDLAFIRLPKETSMSQVKLANGDPKEGNIVVAIGHPFGLKYTATQGIVSKGSRLHGNISYIQVDAAINPGNSGGPLVNKDGEIIGVNTFIIKGGDNLGFALPISYLKDSLAEFKEFEDGSIAIRCGTCSNIVTEKECVSGYCPHCGSKITFPDKEEYHPVGSAKLIEEIITALNKRVKLARRGRNSWEIEEGSATIKITYNEQTRFIVGDAHLCRLPRKNIGEIYEFLLKVNYKLDNLVFSVQNQDVILSFIIYDEYFSHKSGLEIFKNLFDKADEYDNILVEEFGAIWKDKEV